MNEILNNTEQLAEWITYCKTYLYVKDPRKGKIVENFRPISCLPLMWKLMTEVVSESLYQFREKNSLLPGKQKGYRKGSRRTKDPLLTNKTVLRDCKKRHTNLALARLITERPVMRCCIDG